MSETLSLILKLREADAISDIDAEFCRLMHQIHPQITGPVLMAAALVSRAYHDGNVCIMLDQYNNQELFREYDIQHAVKMPDVTEWIDILRQSPVVGKPGDFRPLILDEGGRLYLQKLWTYEQNLASEILKRAAQKKEDVNESLLSDGLKRLFANEDGQPDWQKIAAVTALFNRLTVISGGPGTGKTTTVARLLALLIEQAKQRNQSPSVALAAPTGKAAARLEGSLQSVAEGLNISNEIKDAMSLEAVTIHRLLGARRHSSEFRYNRDNPLPFDVVIVDEASMIDQSLMSRLMDALLDKTRLILLGDKDQLASVEAGSVMGDICGNYNQNRITTEQAEKIKSLGIEMPESMVVDNETPLVDNIVLFTKSYRFKEKSGIGQLAQAINSGDADKALAVLDDSFFSDVALSEVNSYSDFIAQISEKTGTYLKMVQQADSKKEVFDIYRRFRLLAAHRSGPWGVERLNGFIEDTLRKKGIIPPFEQWYAGRPIVINQNDYSLELNNGDQGVCLPDTAGGLKVFFKQDESLRAIWPSRLPDYSTAFALTVHKSQGSEFENVMLALPDARSKVLSRELIYTAVTRARESVQIIGKKTILSAAVTHSVARKSGLKDRLWGKENSRD